MPYIASTVPITILTVIIGIGFLERQKVKDMWQSIRQDKGNALASQAAAGNWMKEEV